MIEAIRQGDIPGVQLRCRQALGLPPEQIWSWLTEPARASHWLAPTVTIEPGVGGHLELAGSDPDGHAFVEVGDTVEWQPGRLWGLRFKRRDEAAWRETTRLLFEFGHPAAGGTELSIFQDGFQRLSLSLCLTVWEHSRRRWRGALERLATAVDTPAATAPGSPGGARAGRIDPL